MAPSLQRLLRWGVVPVRILLGLVFFTAGMGKIWPGHAFPGLIGPVWLIERLEAFQLGLYAGFIAWSQIIIGILLLTQRFARLGTVMLVPMLANIFMVTVSQQWGGTPYVLAVFLLMNLYLLLMDFEGLKWLLSDRVPDDRAPIRRNSRKDSQLAFSILLILAGPLVAPVHLPTGIGCVVIGLLGALLNQYLPRP